MEKETGLRLRKADQAEILADSVREVTLEQELLSDCLRLYMTAGAAPVRMLRPRWYFRDDEKIGEPVRVLGDAWERSYGDLHAGSMSERHGEGFTGRFHSRCRTGGYADPLDWISLTEG